jgi:hypothetical protein
MAKKKPAKKKIAPKKKAAARIRRKLDGTFYFSVGQ